MSQPNSSAIPVPHHIALLQGSEALQDHEDVFRFLQQAMNKIVWSKKCSCLYCTGKSSNPLDVFEAAWNYRRPFAQRAVEAHIQNKAAAQRALQTRSHKVADQPKTSKSFAIIDPPIPTSGEPTSKPPTPSSSPPSAIPQLTLRPLSPEVEGQRRTIQQEMRHISNASILPGQIRKGTNAAGTQSGVSGMPRISVEQNSKSNSRTSTQPPTPTKEEFNQKTSWPPQGIPSLPSEPLALHNRVPPSRPTTPISYTISSTGKVVFHENPHGLALGLPIPEERLILSDPGNPLSRKINDLSYDGQLAMLGREISDRLKAGIEVGGAGGSGKRSRSGTPVSQRKVKEEDPDSDSDGDIGVTRQPARGAKRGRTDSDNTRGRGAKGGRGRGRGGSKGSTNVANNTTSGPTAASTTTHQPLQLNPRAAQALARQAALQQAGSTNSAPIPFTATSQMPDTLFNPGPSSPQSTEQRPQSMLAGIHGYAQQGPMTPQHSQLQFQYGQGQWTQLGTPSPLTPPGQNSPSQPTARRSQTPQRSYPSTPSRQQIQMHGGHQLSPSRSSPFAAQSLQNVQNQSSQRRFAGTDQPHRQIQQSRSGLPSYRFVPAPTAQASHSSPSTNRTWTQTPSPRGPQSFREAPGYSQGQGQAQMHTHNQTTSVFQGHGSSQPPSQTQQRPQHQPSQNTPQSQLHSKPPHQFRPSQTPGTPNKQQQTAQSQSLISDHSQLGPLAPNQLPSPRMPMTLMGQNVWVDKAGIRWTRNWVGEWEKYRA